MKKLIAFGALFGACEVGPVPVFARNEGTLCAFAEELGSASLDPSQAELLPDEVVVFRAILEQCESACIRGERTSCEVEREGDTLTVRSRFRYIEESALLGCILICHEVAASCASDPLEEGVYQVKYGEESYTLEIPSAPGCFE